MPFLRDEVLRYIGKHALLTAGARVAVGCSGGADSVALLRLLLELREPLGLVLSVAHFNHQLRSGASDEDEAFVQTLALHYGIDFYRSGCDVAAQAQTHKESLETAARNARYAYFDSLIASNTIDKVALAHTMNDQAETVLMRLLRGAGGLGMAGMAAWRNWPASASKPANSAELAVGDSLIPTSGNLLRGYVRPLLETTRKEIEAYLKSLNQAWREDLSNQATTHTRNRIRHELLPSLLRDYNPRLIESLSHTAELARAEEEYWDAEIKRILPTVLLPGTPTRGGGRNASLTRSSAKNSPKNSAIAVTVDSLRRLPLAVQRRLIRSMAETLGEALDFEHTAAVLDLLHGKAGHRVQLTGSLTASRTFREIVFDRPETGPVCDYTYELTIPGERHVAELNTTFIAKLLSVGPHSASYNRPNSRSLPGSVWVRNWRPGDKARLAHSKRAKKVKEILQEMHLSGTSRQLWPVIESVDEIVWIRNCELEPLTNGLQKIEFEEKAEDVS